MCICRSLCVCVCEREREREGERERRAFRIVIVPHNGQLLVPTGFQHPTSEDDPILYSTTNAQNAG
jgi:hypothetical protein